MLKVLLTIFALCLHTGIACGMPELIGNIMVDQKPMVMIKSVHRYLAQLYITPDKDDIQKAIAKLHYIRIKDMGEQQLEIRKLWVDPVYRNKGCATCLIERVKNQEMRLAGACEIQLCVGAFEKGIVLSLEDCLKRDEELIRFYQKRGFASSEANRCYMTYRINNTQ